MVFEVDYVEDLKVQSSWVTQMGSKTNEKCLYKGQRRRAGRDRAEMGEAAPSQGIPGPPRAEEAGGELPRLYRNVSTLIHTSSL